MTKLPQKIERIDDGEIFELNKDGKTYSNAMMKKKYPNSLYTEYSYDTLMVKNKGQFRVIDKEE